jgi:glycosyltransferase involved in cell wall biosynthesis
MNKISICVPVYEMKNGQSPLFLTEYFESLLHQTYNNFDIVVSDQSDSERLRAICQDYQKTLDIKYYVNNGSIKNAAANVNFATKHATGDIIKLLYMDDFFVTNHALEKINHAFNTNPGQWLICGFTHCNEDKSTCFDTRLPSYPNKYVNGDNTTGNPSTYAVRRESLIPMDENLLWVVDGEYFYRSYHYYGDPIIINDILVCFREHTSSAFRDPNLNRLEREERLYCTEKYNKMLPIVHQHIMRI